LAFSLAASAATATVWHIQGLARRTVALGIVDQRLLQRHTGAYQLQRDKADIKRHAAADMCELPSKPLTSNNAEQMKSCKRTIGAIVYLTGRVY